MSNTVVRVQVQPRETLGQLYERLNGEGVSASMDALEKATGTTATDQPLGIQSFEFEVFARESLKHAHEIARNLQDRTATSTADENSNFALHVRNVSQRTDAVRTKLYILDPVKEQHSPFTKRADMSLAEKIGWYGVSPIRLFAQGASKLANLLIKALEEDVPTSNAAADLAGYVSELDDHAKGAFAPMFRREMATLSKINGGIDVATQKWLDRIDKMLADVPQDKAQEGVALARLHRVTEAACRGSVAGLNDPDLETRAEQALEMANVPESMRDEARRYIQSQLAEHGSTPCGDLDPSIYDFNWERPVVVYS